MACRRYVFDILKPKNNLVAHEYEEDKKVETTLHLKVHLNSLKWGLVELLVDRFDSVGLSFLTSL